MSSSRRSIFAVVVLAGVVACARIAGLDESGGRALTGTATDAGSTTTEDGAKLTPAQLTIIAVCNRPATSDEFHIKNTSATTLEYTLDSSDPQTITFLDATGANVATLSGTLTAGQLSDKITVVATSGTAGSTAKAFTVTTGNAQTGTTKTLVPIALQVQGGLIELAPPTVDFGAARHDATTAPQDVIITNKGTETVVVAGWDTGGNTAVSMGSNAIAIEGGKTVRTTVAYQAGKAGTSIDATVKPMTQTALCGDVPSLHVTGSSVSTDVTLTPASLPFGDVNCGSGAGPKNLTIANYSSDEASYALSFQSNSWFTSTMPTGTVAKNGGSVSVPISMNAQSTFGSRSEVVTVSVTGTKVDPPISAQIPLTAVIHGVQLSFTPPSLTLASGSTVTVHMTNSGNEGTGIIVNENSTAFEAKLPAFAQIGRAGAAFPSSGLDFTIKATASGRTTDMTMSAYLNVAGSGPICGSPTYHVVSQ